MVSILFITTKSILRVDILNILKCTGVPLGRKIMVTLGILEKCTAILIH